MTRMADEPQDGELLPAEASFNAVVDEPDAELTDERGLTAIGEGQIARRAARKRLFLTALAQTGMVNVACDKSRIPRRTIYDWLERDPKFAQAFRDAQEHATDILEAEARRRAQIGVPEPVYYQGVVVGHVQKYSDLLLMALLNAYRPEKFKNRTEHTGKDGGPMQVVHVSYDHNMKPDDM